MDYQLTLEEKLPLALVRFAKENNRLYYIEPFGPPTILESKTDDAFYQETNLKLFSVGFKFGLDRVSHWIGDVELNEGKIIPSSVGFRRDKISQQFKEYFERFEIGCKIEELPIFEKLPLAVAQFAAEKEFFYGVLPEFSYAPSKFPNKYIEFFINKTYKSPADFCAKIELESIGETKNYVHIIPIKVDDTYHIEFCNKIAMPPFDIAFRIFRSRAD